jgi:3-dehydroquinate synthetase
MKHDKKRVEGQMRFILPKNVGEVFITDDVSSALVESVLEELHEKA